MLGCARHPFRSPNYMRNFHMVVVNYIREMVSRISIGLQEHWVFIGAVSVSSSVGAGFNETVDQVGVIWISFGGEEADDMLLTRCSSGVGLLLGNGVTSAVVVSREAQLRAGSG